MIADDLTTLTASKVSKLIASRKLSSLELVEALLDLIRKREPVVQAWAFLDPDEVRRQAKIRDASRPRGPLHGVPIGIKDVVATVDQPTAFNSPIYTHHRPGADASCVRKLREAGAIIMGKTVTAEFAFRHPGPSRNPHDPSRTPGGSSSGSAAAVAAHMVPAALATQTGGSTIRPAAYCGILGYKPAFGTYDTEGLKYLAPSLDTIGLMARDLEDIALLSCVLTDTQPTSVIPSREPPTVAVFYTPYLDQAKPSAITGLENVARRISAEGARVRVLDAPNWMSCLDSAHGIIMATEAARSLAYEWNTHRSELSLEISELVERGLSCSQEAIAEARANATRGRRWYARHLGHSELVLTLAAPGEAPKSLCDTGSAIFNRFWSASDAACLNLPVERGIDSMPIGIQLVDPTGDETNLLSAAQWLVRVLRLDCTVG
jgi:Asp-tRNA(Asn)/Glu-tRNA(Gln) amidotransferase A subunit family amidase